MNVNELSGAPAATVSLACLRVEGRLYAIDARCIREIVSWQPVTPLPDAPPLIEGVTDLRGAVIPVVSLARVLGLGAAREGPRTRIVVLAIQGLVVGLRVEAASEVLSLDPGELEPPPALTTQAGYEAVCAVVRRPDAEPMLVLDPEHVLNAVRASAEPRPQAAS